MMHANMAFIHKCNMREPGQFYSFAFEWFLWFKIRIFDCNLNYFLLFCTKSSFDDPQSNVRKEGNHLHSEEVRENFRTRINVKENCLLNFGIFLIFAKMIAASVCAFNFKIIGIRRKKNINGKKRRTRNLISLSHCSFILFFCIITKWLKMEQTFV